MSFRQAVSTSGFILSSILLNAAVAEPLSIVSFGGPNQQAQIKAFYTPFQAATKIKVDAISYNGDYSQIEQAHETGSPRWDLVEVESPELLRGCEAGVFEKISWTKLGNATQFVPGAVSRCGAAIFVWSTVLAVKNGANTPKDWAQFWDVKKFPGKRGMRKGAKYNLEFALLADGVKPNQIYEVLSTADGVDRAFRKLQQLKPNIVWWEAGDQPQQWLQAGQVSASTAYSGRVALAKQKGVPIQAVWHDSIYDFDSWAIVKGSPNREAALKFLESALKPERQAVFAEAMSYGPTLYDAIPKVKSKFQADLPTSPANMVQGISLDVVFWALYGDKLEKRFSSWVAAK
ncbi:ABC transporter substrate-binding protein [Leeia sp. TBRC 13508]|uniref:ABC transporter substrate-binding protein n=1 Tax=Leeia speluncae TaxID=2884804 RepID=A0ABS8D4Q5_9NEIS|nr:ABC transporter substrate-binding protein [Leeia speluncae]MCB6183196.1 ABC transporter substrate-binding protein [Leeia speluncae]